MSPIQPALLATIELNLSSLFQILCSVLSPTVAVIMAVTWAAAALIAAADAAVLCYSHSCDTLIYDGCDTNAKTQILRASVADINRKQ